MDTVPQTTTPVPVASTPVDQPIRSARDEGTAPSIPKPKGSPMSKLMWGIVIVVVLGMVSAISYYLGIQKGESGQLQKVLQKN